MTTDEVNPDKEKIRDYAIRLAKVKLPVMESEVGKTALRTISESLDSVIRDMMFWADDNYHIG